MAVPTPSQILVAREIRQVRLAQLEEEEREQGDEEHPGVAHYGLLSDVIQLVHVLGGVWHKVAVETYQEGAEGVG